MPSRFLWLMLAAIALPGLGRAQVVNDCLQCHSVLDPPYKVTAEQFSLDIHSQKGLTCASCHGGDPTKTDMDAMSKSAGFRGKITREQIPALCGSCHSNAAYMKKYNPSLRTDQLSQYKTSAHGKLLAKGDTKVAVCTDCHGVHDLRAVDDVESSVYPLNVAKTCSRCHSDANYMKGYNIPTNQFAEYNTSVHHAELVDRGDLSAPTCSTCHGNHGAAPPGVNSVANVCSNCHVFQAQMYDKSSHKAAFEAAGLPGCVVCHSNHAITKPTDAKLSTGPEGVCMRCHTPGDDCDRARATMLAGLTNLNDSIQQANKVLGFAESSGMEVGDSRLVLDQAKDSLTKARVTIHSFQESLVDTDIQAGMNFSAKAMAGGKAGLAERDYRRRGLGLSLIFILATVLGLYFYIRKIERSPSRTE